MHNRPLHSVTPGYSHGWRCTAIGVHGGCAPAEGRQLHRWSWSSLSSVKILSGYYSVGMLWLFQLYRIGSRDNIWFYNRSGQFEVAVIDRSLGVCVSDKFVSYVLRKAVAPHIRSI
jgi:hypothetical protein